MAEQTMNENQSVEDEAAQLVTEMLYIHPSEHFGIAGSQCDSDTNTNMSELASELLKMVKAGSPSDPISNFANYAHWIQTLQASSDCSTEAFSGEDDEDGVTRSQTLNFILDAG
ncbi:hypothetical protein Salat_1474100 [Sesamum alatum]|uniref:Uncharacterized protein n=1 Tax=Sesamum alatum TaxID=300844 RepID=A0AAE2CLY7_9LAMI|nr:hypothetical protein Salat_1474100 [Sesamum alatum]